MLEVPRDEMLKLSSAKAGSTKLGGFSKTDSVIASAHGIALFVVVTGACSEPEFVTLDEVNGCDIDVDVSAIVVAAVWEFHGNRMIQDAKQFQDTKNCYNSLGLAICYQIFLLNTETEAEE